MPREILKNSAGSVPVVQEGESCKVTATFIDTDGNTLAKSSILTLRATLINAHDGTVINSRNAQDVLDANGGTLASDGTLDLILGPTDNVVVFTEVGEETHYLLLTWTWQDTGGNSLTGKQEFSLSVEALTDPVTP